ncbi:MAG TPA: hypothetical protein VN873_03875 [Candidatus Angelobacter sp.]|nr:hypothetical protein [Candidatus Angelobacter sp.]
MRDVKFNCTSCGQHIQCDETYVNEQIPCPGCATLVRVPANASLVEKIPTTPTGLLGGENVPTLEDNFRADEKGTPLPSEPPLTEREQQLAAARKEHAAHASQIKPRLSFILSGGAAPVPEENQKALEPPEQKNPEGPPDDTKTVQE